MRGLSARDIFSGARPGLQQVLSTKQLASRPSRMPEYAAESRALHDLAAELANPAGNVLSRLCQLVLELCHAHSVGISLAEYEANADIPATGQNRELLVSFQVLGETVGAVWALSHDDVRNFDGEDARMVESLAAFAAVAFTIRGRLGRCAELNDELSRANTRLNRLIGREMAELVVEAGRGQG
jgi:hypothetical protein